MPKVIVEKVYLYSLWKGELKIHEGSIYESMYNDSASFKANKKDLNALIKKG
jgi:hypothetical protein